MMRFSFLLSSFLLLNDCVNLLLVQAYKRIRADGVPEARTVTIVNKSRFKNIDLYWIHPQTNELTDSSSGGTGIMLGADLDLNSFVGHKFEVQEKRPGCMGQGADANCQRAWLTVTANEDQIFTLNENFKLDYEDHRTKAQRGAKEVVKACERPTDSNSDTSPIDQVDSLMACLQESMDSEVQKVAEEVKFQAAVRQDMGARLSQYACPQRSNAGVGGENDAASMAEPLPPLATKVMETTPSLVNETWGFKRVQVLFLTDHSTVQLVENFLSPQECETVLAASEPAAPEPAHLKAPASVRILREQRDQLTAHISHRVVPLASKKDPSMLKITQRVHDFVSHKLRMDVDYDDEGPLLHVRTTSEAETDSASAQDRADVPEEAIAKLTIVCQVPETGGAMYWPRIGHYVQPKMGLAIWTAYSDPATGLTDDEPYVRESVTCPVWGQEPMTLVEDTFFD